jgi:ribosome-binding factor A
MTVRKTRLADQMRDVIAECFLGGKMSDPRTEGVTITAVVLSGDLQIAKVYFRLYDTSENKIEQATKGLHSASTLLKRRLAAEIDVRRIPELKFFYDESLERAARVDELLSKI